MISTQNFPNCNKKFTQPSKEVANVKTTRKSVANGKIKTKLPPHPPKRKTPL
jgi:hypothetical protein